MLEKQNAADIVGPLSTLVRQRGSRLKTRASNLVSAAEAIGPIAKGMIVTGVTKGSFSMLDLIEHVLAKTGAADVDVSTWTVGIYDADVLWRFASSGYVRRIRFMLDPSMFDLRGRYAPEFLAAFGGDAVRAVKNHAKFTVISNEAWQVTICSLMNLNRNARLENFVIFEGPEAAGFYGAIVDAVFAQVRPLSDVKKVSRDAFEALDLGGGDGRADRADIDNGRDHRHQRGPSRPAVEVW